MPAVAKKAAKLAKPKAVVAQPKKQTLKKKQKTAEINAAKKLAKLKSSKAISDKLNRAPIVKRQKAKHQFDPVRLNRGVMLIKNLPKGFYETQLNQYFSQYGDVTRLRLARSERTGGSKGFAYIEFKYPEVAKVAAESMDNYLMFRQKLKTVYIPPDQQDHDYFKQTVQFVQDKNGKTKLVTPATIRAAKAVANYNKPVSAEAQANRVERSKYKLNFLEKKLAKAGINIDLSGQLYAGNPKKSDSVGNKKGTEAANKKGKDKKETKPSKKAKKEEKPNGNTTLENLMENTIGTSDEDNDDDDYEPTADEIAEADRFVQHLFGEETDDENDTTLNRFLNDTIDSDESGGDDYEPSQEEIEAATAAAQKAGKKLSKIDSTAFVSKKNAKNANKKPAKKAPKNQKAADNDTTLDRLLNNTIDSDDSGGDDYKPTPDEIKKAKLNAQKVTKKPQKKDLSAKKGAQPLAQVQKKRKGAQNEATELKKQDAPIAKKKKLVEPVTPQKPAKVRTNFVTAPTPENVQKKNKSKANAAADGVKLPIEKQKKSKKSAALTKEVKPSAKKQTPAASPLGITAKKTKQPKKGLNKKK